MTRPALIAAALLAASPAGAGGWSAPVFDVPPPLPIAAPTTPAFNPWAPYVAAGLLLLILASDHDGGHHTDPTGPVVPPDPVTPDPSPVPLPGAGGMLAGALSLLGLRKLRDRDETQAAGWA